MPTEQPDDKQQPQSYRDKLLSSELAERIVSGVAIAAFAFVMVYWSPKAFAALMFLVAAAMSWEWGRIVRGSSPDIGTVVHVLAVLATAVLSAAGMAGLGVATAVIGAIAVAALEFGTGRSQLSGAGVLYTGLPVVALGWLRGDEPLGFLATLFVLFSVAVTDIAAYAGGRLIGGPKLWEVVSPKKTWAGLIVGVVAAAVAGALFSALSGTGSSQWLASLGFVMGLVAQVGDLAESALKRHFGLKDASDLIPGHGGFMDRMDGVVTASIAAALIAFAIDAFAPARALLYGS
jgi:phosphatidate cytidylyltransferase